MTIYGDAAAQKQETKKLAQVTWSLDFCGVVPPFKCACAHREPRRHGRGRWCLCLIVRIRSCSKPTLWMRPGHSWSEGDGGL